jgi:lipopolysaccharide/colanic/teichoic acid biosynthesis glycosyltransferase
MPLDGPSRPTLTGAFAKRLLDLVGAALLLAALAVVFLACALVIKLESAGPVLYRCRRVGRHGREFEMLKFRKMRADAAGPPLTSATDERFTRVGAWLARTKLDELPQLWNVLRGEMSLVGPRPEGPEFVAAKAAAFAPILTVKPGMTGYCQLAFAGESAVLDRDEPERRVERYLEQILPQKLAMDALYARRQNLLLDLRILVWTVACVLLRREVAVHRETGGLSLRRRPRGSEELAIGEHTPALAIGGQTPALTIGEETPALAMGEQTLA